MDVRQERVKANGISFVCDVAGSGPLVLLLHGFPQSRYEWRRQLRPLAEHFTVVAPDLRGYGDSDKPRRVRDYRMSVLSADVAALVRAFGADKAHIAAHDWGAAVAWDVAVRHREVVDRLAIVNCPPAWTLAKHMRRGPRQLRMSWYILFFQLPLLPERLVREKIEAVFMATTADRAAFTAEDLAAYRAVVERPGGARSMINWYRAAARYPSDRRPPGLREHGVTAPTLVIWGEKDTALDKRVTYDFPDFVRAPYRIEYLPDASHWVVEEQPERVSALLLEHFGASAR